MPVLQRIQIPAVGTPYETVRHGFRGGINNYLSDENLSQEELSDASNYVPDLSSTADIIKREGLTSASSAQTEAITSVWQGKNANYFSTSTTIRNFAGTSLDSGLTSSATPDWESFLGNDIFCNGTEVRTSTNGTTFAALGGTPPAFRYLAAHNNFLFGAGHSLGILRWADTGTVATWTAGNFLTITNDQNNNITGLAQFGKAGILMVFLRQGFCHVNGFTTLDMAITYSAYQSVGCAANRSIIVTENFIAWWSDLGPVLSYDGVNVQVIGVPRIPATLDALNKAQYGNVHGVWNLRQQRLEWYVHNGASQTTQNRALYYYYNEVAGHDALGRPLGSWWIQDGTGTQMGASGVAVISGESRVYVGSASTSGRLYYQDGTKTSDDGTLIASYIETGKDSPISAFAKKRIRRLGLQTVLSGNATVSYGVYLDDATSLSKQRILNLQAGGFILGVSQLGLGALGSSSTGTQATPMGLARKYRNIKHRISDSNFVRVRLRSISNDGFIVST